MVRVVDYFDVQHDSIGCVEICCLVETNLELPVSGVAPSEKRKDRCPQEGSRCSQEPFVAPLKGKNTQFHPHIFSFQKKKETAPFF